MVLNLKNDEMYEDMFGSLKYFTYLKKKKAESKVIVQWVECLRADPGSIHNIPLNTSSTTRSKS